MKQSEVDPYVFYKLVDGKIKLITGVHVDDKGKVKKLLGIWYEWCKDDNGVVYLKLSMPKLDEEIAQKAEEVQEEMHNSKLKGYDSPGVLGTSLAKNGRRQSNRSCTG